MNAHWENKNFFWCLLTCILFMKINFSESSLFPASPSKEIVFGLNIIRWQLYVLKKIKVPHLRQITSQGHEGTNVFVELVLVISEESWKVGKGLNDWKQENVTIIFEMDSENYRLISILHKFLSCSQCDSVRSTILRQEVSLPLQNPWGWQPSTHPASHFWNSKI